MSIISIVVVLIVVGLLLYLVNNFIPMDDKIKQLMNIVVLIAVVLWILSIFLGGSFGELGCGGPGIRLR